MPHAYRHCAAYIVIKSANSTHEYTSILRADLELVVRMHVRYYRILTSDIHPWWYSYAEVANLRGTKKTRTVCPVTLPS